ncbi:hypothetical protein [Sphingobacterium sp. LRF_L2]|uniref:hypothetical protein n=1 Tax=Sphingobacterium sp. LRF_L2 TaxID=3369421 RepID=UPI003F5FFF11
MTSALATYFLSVKLKQGPVRASSLIALVFSGALYFFPNLLPSHLSQNLPAVVIGSSFIGMVSSERLSTFLGIAFAGLIFAVIFINTSRYFDGYGGALGTAACISVLVVMSIPYLNSKRRMTVGILQLRRLLFGKKRK